VLKNVLIPTSFPEYVIDDDVVAVLVDLEIVKDVLVGVPKTFKNPDKG
jgi:hypothetical protein